MALLKEEDIAILESFQDSVSGYFGKMLLYLEDFVKRGVEEGRFTETEAYEDLDIALWCAYACINLEKYEYYYRVTKWMPASEKNARGCATWYYRYSCALMYCGKLAQAQTYAEKGVLEEPDYPWCWLQVAKLRSHFGDRAGSLAAVQKGLSLVPGDFEFLTLQKEINEGRTLAEMEYHYIDPDNDQQLQEGQLTEDDREKRDSIMGILCDEEALVKIKEVLQPADWVADCPYCSFHFTTQGRELEIVFCMNEAALSKMDAEWLRMQMERLQDEAYLIRRGNRGVTYELQTVFFNRDRSVELAYINVKTKHSFCINIKRGEQKYSALMADPRTIDTALAQAEREAQQERTRCK